MCRMCFLTSKKPIQLVETILKSEWGTANDDGVGIVYREATKDNQKTVFETLRWGETDLMEAVPVPYDRMLIHFRKSTTGIGTHPFTCLDTEAGKGWYLTHNGIIRQFDKVREALLKDKKHVFSGSIDSEIFIHLWADSDPKAIPEVRWKWVLKQFSNLGGDIDSMINFILYNTETDEWIGISDGSLSLAESVEGPIVVCSDTRWIKDVQNWKITELNQGDMVYGQGTKVIRVVRRAFPMMIPKKEQQKETLQVPLVSRIGLTSHHKLCQCNSCWYNHNLRIGESIEQQEEDQDYDIPYESLDSMTYQELLYARHTLENNIRLMIDNSIFDDTYTNATELLSEINFRIEEEKEDMEDDDESLDELDDDDEAYVTSQVKSYMLNYSQHEDKKIKCWTCNERINERLLSAHLRQEHNKTTNCLCMALPKEKYPLQYLVCENHKPEGDSPALCVVRKDKIVCNICMMMKRHSKNFPNMKSWLSHYVAKHKNKEEITKVDSDTPYHYKVEEMTSGFVRCHCGILFGSIASFREHMSTMYPSNNSAERKSVLATIRDKTKGEFKCKKCGEGFEYPATKDNHERTCRMYTCNPCPVPVDKFESLMIFTDHLLSQHRDKIAFAKVEETHKQYELWLEDKLHPITGDWVCGLCNSSLEFHSMTDFRDHFKTNHALEYREQKGRLVVRPDNIEVKATIVLSNANRWNYSHAYYSDTYLG